MKTRVIVAVSDYWLVGAVSTTGVRVQDVLKDGNTEFLRVDDVQVRSNLDRESSLADLPEVVVPKCRIEFVAILESRHEAPTKRRNYYTAKDTSDVFLILGKYRIQGEFHLPSSSKDSLYALTFVDTFIPVTQAGIHGVGPRLIVPVLFANKEFLNGFHLGKPAPAETPSVTP
ncbi:MAG: hypothetical protein ACE5KM_02105 [Planctomycetaceae bacterium]